MCRVCVGAFEPIWMSGCCKISLNPCVALVWFRSHVLGGWFDFGFCKFDGSVCLVADGARHLRYVYIQLRVIPNKRFVFHLDIGTSSHMAVRVSLGNVFTAEKFSDARIQLPVSPPARW